MQIREGEDLQLRLTSVIPEMISCYVRTPLLINYNLMSEESDSAGRISYWTENGECGFIAKGVTKADHGRWRLTAQNSTSTLVDAASVVVLGTTMRNPAIRNNYCNITFISDKYPSVPVRKNISIESGLGYTLTLEEQSKYCLVSFILVISDREVKDFLDLVDAILVTGPSTALRRDYFDIR